MKHKVLTANEAIDALNSNKIIVSGNIPYQLINESIYRVVNNNPVEVTHDVYSFVRMHHFYLLDREYSICVFDMVEGKEYCAKNEDSIYRRNGNNVECLYKGEWKRATFHTGIPMFAIA